MAKLDYHRSLTYYDADGMVYWTMGEPLEKTIIINRCKTEDTYERRLRKGTLPAPNDRQAEPNRADGQPGLPA